jgi:hypothetical protein
MIGVDHAARMPLASAICLDSCQRGSRATSVATTGSRRNAAVPLAPASGPTTSPSASCRPTSIRLGAAATVSVSLPSSSSRTAQRAPLASDPITLASTFRISISGASRAIRSST